MEIRVRGKAMGIALLSISALLLGSAISPAYADKAYTPAYVDRSYTLADVKTHSTSKNCWTVVGSGVFNLTDWVGRHAGGSAFILAMCGVDATTSFRNQHGLIGPEANRLATFRVGALSKPKATPIVAANSSASASSAASPSPKASASATPAANNTFTSAQVASHGAVGSCWTVVNSSVYNVTSWIARHPGGGRAIVAMCGANATAAFASRHGSATSAATTLRAFRIGAWDKTVGASLLPTMKSGIGHDDDDNKDDD